MNNVKTVFSIKDLENLSGIKAHTIRIWEKRYDVLQPMRTESNIRLYDLASLQKLLNITLLHNHGYKISKISQFPPEKIPQLVREILSERNTKSHAINAFKIAMLNFDQAHFINTYNTLLSEKSFREIFYEVFIPLMDDLGILWQTDTITPAQEHFISCLIRQKLCINTEKAQLSQVQKDDRVFVLYLPSDEIHELGLMYVNYELIANGCKTVYLGANVPVGNLADLSKHFEKIVYITYLTVQPGRNHVDAYIKTMGENILGGNSEFWILGRQTEYIDQSTINQNTKVFFSISAMVSQL